MTGAVVWFTGLPSSGKSLLARRVLARLDSERRPCCLLDGDRVREILSPKPGYSPAERANFYLTLGRLAAELATQGLVVLVAATAHRRIYRDQVRALVPQFIEVWLHASLEECRRRDAKGLYEHFASGAVHELPGEDVSYEAPPTPEVTASGGDDNEAFAAVLARLHAPVGPA
jgi:adenylylsulfate kinase